MMHVAPPRKIYGTLLSPRNYKYWMKNVIPEIYRPETYIYASGRHCNICKRFPFLKTIRLVFIHNIYFLILFLFNYLKNPASIIVFLKRLVDHPRGDIDTEQEAQDNFDADGDPTLKQHLISISCLLRRFHIDKKTKH